MADRLGSVRAELVGGGTATARHDYDAYGVPQGPTAPQDYGYTQHAQV